MRKHKSQSKEKNKQLKPVKVHESTAFKLSKINLNNVIQMKNLFTIRPYSNFEIHRPLVNKESMNTQAQQSEKRLNTNFRSKQLANSIEFSLSPIKDNFKVSQENLIHLKANIVIPDVESDMKQLNIQPSKISKRQYGRVKAYATNTHAGLLTNSNQDRITIITNLTNVDLKSKQNELISYFAIYAGHNGSICSQYLRDLLHLYISKDPQFTKNISNAIRNGINKLQAQFFKEVEKKNQFSGSSAMIIIIKGTKCYISNIGDSRAIMSVNYGSKIIQLSNDHTPNSQVETKRIKKAGGNIILQKLIHNCLIQPKRVYPGNLQVTRSIGDYELKNNKNNNLNNKPTDIIISQPQITQIDINQQIDFIFMASW